jgi:predicted nucleotidyltransferase
MYPCSSSITESFGTNVPESDVDYRGVFSISSDAYFCLNRPLEQVSDEKNDTTYYTVFRFLELACAGNPNILELLWSPDDCVLKTSDMWEQIKAIRKTFITKSVLDSFGGYAVTQIKKAKGQNKLINNPMPERKPTKVDFCWIVPMQAESFDLASGACEIRNAIHGTFPNHKIIGEVIEPPQMPFRPRKVSESDYRYALSFYECAAVEHCVNTYRLYYYGSGAKGIFRGDESADIVPSSIPIEDEYKRFKGLLIYHKDAYERELKLWKQYWDWRENRNEARWIDQENKKLDYDGKNMMHCLRLLYSGENILKNGEPLVRFEGERLQWLKDIRAGKLQYEEILAEAEKRLAALNAAKQTCALPVKVNLDTVSELSVKFHRALFPANLKFKKIPFEFTVGDGLH